MEIPVGGGEIEFQSNYRLLELGKGLASPMAALGFPSFSAVQDARNNMDVHLKKLESYNAQMKVLIAQETPNGESFIRPLDSCRTVLERLIAISQSKMSHSSSTLAPQIQVSASGRAFLHNTYSLIVEKILFYFQNIRQARKEMGVLLLDVLCLILTLDSELHSIFPQVFASCLLFFKPTPDWKDAGKEVMKRLCYYILPKCLDFLHSCPWMNMSASIMMVLEGCSASKDHLFIISTLMQSKRNVCSDLLSTLAYGTDSIRPKALDLLLYYWPLPIPEFSQRSNSIHGEWSTPLCENGSCPHKTSVAQMLCLDPLCVAQYKQNSLTKLYMLVCPECDSVIHGSPPHGGHMRLRVPRPLHDVKPNCEFQKICLGKERQVNRAEVTCYDPHCTAIQQGQPIHMCRDCHSKQHKDVDDPRHIYQVCPPDPWANEDPTLCTVMLEAISKLLETTPTRKDTPSSSRGVGTIPRSAGPHHLHYVPNAQIEVGLSREGMWMVSHYCTPTTTVRESQQEWLVHLVALTLHWLQCYYDLLHCAAEETQPLPPGEGGTDYVDSAVLSKDYSHDFANFSDISNLVNSYTLPWFGHVCESNLDCVSEVLKPDPSGSGPFSRLWNESHDQMQRHKQTLSILHTLYLLYQGGKLSEQTFLTVFKTVMPQWLDYLNSLRSEPGKMQLLREPIGKIFSEKKHPEGLKTFGFIWDMFRDRTGSPDNMHKALLWLQDLTRLKVPVTYLKHMFEDALKQREKSLPRYRYMVSMESSGSAKSSFDQESERRHRDSTGSMSGYESESALLSQGSMDINSDTEMLITLNSSLTRFIIMLDIWLSQLLDHPVLSSVSSIPPASSLHTILTKMLRHTWGTSHTYQDHREHANLCLLCKGMELWFRMASKLIREYAHREREESTAEHDEEVHSPLSAHFKGPAHALIKVTEKISTPILKKRKFVSAAESPDLKQLNHPKTKKISTDSIEMLELSRHTTSDEDTSPPKTRPIHQPPSNPARRPRKMPIVQPRELEVISSFGGVAQEKVHPDCDEEGETVALYTVFQLTIEKLTFKLHPAALLQIIHCLEVLVRDAHVFKRAADKKQLLADLKQLFEKLWQCLEADTSNVTRSCVGLLLECVDYMASQLQQETRSRRSSEAKVDEERVKSKLEGGATREGEKEEGDETEKCLFWSTLKAGLSSGSWTTRYKTAEKLTSILQFMLSCEVVGLEHGSFHKSLKMSLAHGFCLLVRLLQDKNSNVCARSRYCITSIKESALEAIRHFLIVLFEENPAHQTLVTHTLSLLDSALPEVHFLNLDLLNKLLGVALHGKGTAVSLATSKISDSSLLGSVALLKGVTPKLSTVSSASATVGGGAGVTGGDRVTTPLAQQLLSLLLRHVGNPRANIKTSTSSKKPNQSAPQTPKKSNTIKKAPGPTSSEQVFVSLLQKEFFVNFDFFPHELRANSIFQVFLNHISFVLDHNIEFGQTRGLLSLILKLLAYSAAPDMERYTKFEQEERHASSGGPEYGLGALPSHLQAPWLRVFFVILYKYIHEYCETSESSGGFHHRVYSLASWCFGVTLNTFECSAHVCPRLTSADGKKRKPSLRRQLTLESCGSDDAIMSPLQDVSGARNLTPVPEDLEGSKVIEASLNTPRSRVTFPEEILMQSTSTLGPGGKDLGEGKFEPPEEDNTPSFTKGRCVVCGGPTNEFSEEVMALCAVVVGMYCNRLPHVVPRYLVSRIIPALTKVITPGSYNWQRFSHSNSPGSATSVAQHMLVSILTQFGERRLFLYLFGYKYGEVKEAVFEGIASSLGEAEGEAPPDPAVGGVAGGGGGGGGGDKEGEAGLSQSSPIKYFLEDAISSLHFTQDVSKYTFINLAAYLTALDKSYKQQATPPLAPPILLTRELPLWDAFLKKLRGHSEVLKDRKTVPALLEVFITLFQYTVDCQYPQYSLSNYRAHAVQSVIQSLLAIVERVLHSVYCPLGGIVMLGGLWYRVFQQHSHRESEKLMKLVISELRKALKVKLSFGDVVVPENFLSLTQVFLLEEEGYLGYVDGLSHMKHFAPDLKRDYETHCLPVIQSTQWDLTDILSFLSTPSTFWPFEMVPQLKLSLAQLISLRVQHGRSPVEKLRKMMAGDNKTIPSHNTKSIAGSTLWQSSLDSLHMLSWLLLGAMSHNAIHSVATEMRTVTSSGGQCLLLESLSPRMEEVVQRAINLTRNVLRRIGTVELESKFDYIELTFLFGVILTVYLELYMVEGSAPLILEYWEKVAGCLSHQIASTVNSCSPPQLASTIAYCSEVIHSLDAQVVTRIREIDLSSFPLLLPVLQEVAENSIPTIKLKFESVDTIRQATYTPVEVWFDEAVRELFRIEMESLPNNS